MFSPAAATGRFQRSPLENICSVVITLVLSCSGAVKKSESAVKEIEGWLEREREREKGLPWHSG